MIDPSTLPTWPEIYSRIGAPVPRRNRGRCLIHGGDSLTSVSLDHERGLYHCHVCGAGGDRVDFLMKILDIDFSGALRWFGLEPGKPPAPDPELLLQHQHDCEMEDRLRQQCRTMREEFRVRGQVILRAHERLLRDPEDAWAWNWLQWAYTGMDAIEYFLDTHDLKREHRTWRHAA